MVRKGLKHILETELSSPLFAEADDGEQAMELLQSADWDLLILDMDLPVLRGIEVLKKIKSNSIFVPVLVFSFHDLEPFKRRALTLGASDYLTKDASEKDILQAVKSILYNK